MIDRLIEFCAANRVIVFVFTAVGCVAGLWAMRGLPLDAIPDLGETQVIIYSRWERSPDLMEAQVTYPIASAMLGAPRVKAVRGLSDFGYSYVYVIFEEGTDPYWARTRTLEYLSTALQRLPSGVQTELGPDASGLGWVYQYALVDPSGRNTLDDMRSFQDWYLRYYLKALPGVAEVAPVGGMVRQYQVSVDPRKLQSFRIPMSRIIEAVRAGNSEAGGRMIEMSGAEYMVRAGGYAQSMADIGGLVLQAENGVPVRVSDVAEITMGPDLRRGVADLDGTGDVVSGIVVMRQGENALRVIDRVKAKLKEIEPGLPPGMKVVTGYDRSELIRASIATLNSTLVEELVVVSLVILMFLWHIPSALIPMVTIPIAILLSFIPMRMMGMTANIMSLGGIAIAVGALVDAAIVVVEQTHKKLERWESSGRQGSYQDVVVGAVKEVAGPSFFALLVIAVSFLPVLALEAEEGRLFKPLAYTKSFSMIIAAVLAITLDPALRLTLTHLRNFNFRPRWLCRAANGLLVGRIRQEEGHPVSRFLIRHYQPVCVWALRHKWQVLAGAGVILLATVPAALSLGGEFMPPLDEMSLFYMPSTLPGISVAQAQSLLQVQDRVIRQFPEVARVLGKAGRAETATDPAPLSMMETVITLKPKGQWRKKATWYSGWAPEWLKTVLRPLTSDAISTEELVAEMNEALRLPGVSNAWTMPIRGRIDMLSTNIRTPVGVKISGADTAVIERLGKEIETVLGSVPGTRSAFAERAATGYFVDLQWKREELARYGLRIDQVQEVVQSGIGGESVTTTVEGRERYSINVRFQRDFRGDLESLRHLPVAFRENAGSVPLGQLAEVKVVNGPSMLRSENGILTGYVYVDVAGRDVAGYVDQARRLVGEKVKMAPGYTLQWSGQFESIQRVRESLRVVLPVTIGLILLLLYLNTKSMAKTMIVLLAVPFSAVGAVWLLYLLGYHMSIGVWVGLVALMGVDAETGVFMLLYLDLSYAQAAKEGRLRNLNELRQAILHGAVQRIRPKFMTVACTFLALLPILWATGTGADVMKRIAAPMVGGIFTSFLLELVVYPVAYEIWRWDFRTPGVEVETEPAV